MAANIEESVFFREKREKDGVIVRDPPKFDLESYISNYEGRTRLERLSLIGTTSTYLSLDALRIAINEAKKGRDVSMYQDLTTTLYEILPDDPLALPDMDWIESTNRQVKTETDRLETELKAYKNNLIKESIRMGNEDLGNHSYQIGDLSAAFKAYNRMRDYCTSAAHVATMSLHIVLVSISQRSWMQAQSHLLKVDSQSLKPEERAKLEPITTAMTGLTYMGMGQFKDAASTFLGTSTAYLTAEPIANINFQRQVLSPNDVAVYGGLCALASMDRAELQKKVLENSDFRNFLELEPHIRRMISMFCGSKYSGCLEILEAYRSDYLLDLFLQPCLPAIYSRIRSKSIQQYFVPFSCVTLDEMATAFQTTGETSIEDELVQMIQSGTLNARIDLVERLLISPSSNHRHTVHTSALKMADDYEKTLRLRLLRMNMQAGGLELRPPRGNTPGFDSDPLTSPTMVEAMNMAGGNSRGKRDGGLRLGGF